MAFVPVSGTAVFTAAEPPRESTVEFRDERRTVILPMLGALPILTKAHARDDLHPSVRLLSGAALLGMRLVAAGQLEPARGSWRIAPLGAEDTDRVRLLAQSRAYDDLDPAAAEVLVRGVLDAVADALPRAAPVSMAEEGRGLGPGPGEPLRGLAAGLRPAEASSATGPGDFQSRLQARISRHDRLQRRGAELPQLVKLQLRVEADEEDLAAGGVRVIPQVVDERDPLHLCDAARLWTEGGSEASHGFGERARTHASIALRTAAEAWPPVERLLDQRLPDQIVLDADELGSLLETGVEAMDARGIEVLWPRSLGRDLTAHSVLDMRPTTHPRSGQESALFTSPLGGGAIFEFRWQVALHGDDLTEAEMEQLAQAAGPAMQLRGAWTVVHPSIARKAKKRLARRVKAAEAIAVALAGPAGLVPEGEGAAPAEQVVVGASLLKVRDRIVGAATRPPVEVPAGLTATLRDYQRVGLTWAAELTALGLGACLADDMGLGKTVTLIALHLHRAARGEPGPTLVVCPASLLGNWESEIARFAPGVASRRHHGGARDLSGLEGGFVLTTYATMRRDSAALAEVEWGLVVADEAQHVKNARSGTAKALRAIPHGARVALTGTPVENNLSDLWAILDWATPGLLGSRLAFRKVWAAPIESGADPGRATQFAELIGPFLLRRRKSDPGIAPELPAKTETDHALALTREQVVLYEAFVRDTMARIERADEDTRRGLVLALLTGLKQICNHPAHFLKQTGGQLPGRSQKLDLLDELLEVVLAAGSGVLVFTQYVAMARLLERHLTDAGLEHQFLHGGTPIREREAMVRRFQESPDGQAPVFLLSLKAGGVGLNLTRADHVVHVDRWWNPAVEEQATDRAYRIGQTRPVQVHRMITRGTIEERIAELLARKQAVADAVLGRGEAALTELGDAELRDLVTYRPGAR